MSWRESAACRGTGIAPFFSKRTSPEGQAAIEVCQGCPVRESCLAECLETEKIRIGIRGGLGPYERDEQVKDRR
jgi:hypothetical protein